MDFGLSNATRGVTRFVDVRGDIDLQSADTLIDRLNALIEPSATQVVVDLTGTTFIDSAGLSALVDAHNRAEHHGVDLVFICPENHRAVRKMLEITGLSALLTIRPAINDVN